jgi:hypothetical protein
MKINARELALLRAISHQPRTSHSLTHAENGVADVQCSPHVFHAYLAHLTDLGLIEAPERHDGKYTASGEGIAYLANLPQVAPSTLICPASMKDPYVPVVGYQRNDGLKHLRSFGHGC